MSQHTRRRVRDQNPTPPRFPGTAVLRHPRWRRRSEGSHPGERRLPRADLHPLDHALDVPLPGPQPGPFLPRRRGPTHRLPRLSRQTRVRLPDRLVLQGARSSRWASSAASSVGRSKAWSDMFRRIGSGRAGMSNSSTAQPSRCRIPLRTSVAFPSPAHSSLGWDSPWPESSPSSAWPRASSATWRWGLTKGRRRARRHVPHALGSAPTRRHHPGRPLFFLVLRHRPSGRARSGLPVPQASVAEDRFPPRAPARDRGPCGPLDQAATSEMDGRIPVSSNP